MGGDTGAVCVPSRAALHTGCGSRRALANPKSEIVDERHRIKPGHTLLGEAFGSAGYCAHAVGKWHNDPMALNRGFASGSALFIGGMCNHENPPLHAYDPSGKYPANKAVNAPGFSTELFADAAIEFIENSNDQPEPFFLYCAFTSPHDPRTPPHDIRVRYRDQELKLPENFLPQHPFDNGELEVRDERLAPLPRDPETTRKHLGDYYGMIEHHDHHLGRMITALERTGQLANTIIVYVSDHGLAMGSHGLMGKQNLYEHSLRVPLIISGPGVPREICVRDEVYAHRLFATLAELAGLPLPATVDAPSLVPLWAETAPARMEGSRHFAHYRDTQRMVRDERWKLITYDLHDGRREQLFDLLNDPHERQDRSADAAVAEHRDRLSEALNSWSVDGSTST